VGFALDDQAAELAPPLNPRARPPLLAAAPSPDPPSAARGDTPERYTRTLAVSIAPTGDLALVFLGMNEPPDLYPYQVLCRRTDAGWEEDSGSNGSGSIFTTTEAGRRVEVESVWGPAPSSGGPRSIRLQGKTHNVAVANGYSFAAAWTAGDEPDEPEDGGTAFINERQVALASPRELGQPPPRHRGRIER
jgi:hypothetical protein